MCFCVEKRRRQRAEDSESRRRNVEASNNSARAERNRETGGNFDAIHFGNLIIKHKFTLYTGLLVKRESSRTELFGSTSDTVDNVHDDDRYDQLFMQASRRIGDDVSTPSASLTGSSAYRSNYNTRGGQSTPRNFFDDV